MLANFIGEFLRGVDVVKLPVLVEPGGGIALAAVLAGKLTLNGANTILVLSGGNIDMPLLETMLR